MSAESETVEYLSGEMVEQIIREWVRQAAAIASASGSITDYEKGFLAGVAQMRNLHLAEPWHLRREIFDALKLAGWVPPEGSVLVDYASRSDAA